MRLSILLLAAGALLAQTPETVERSFPFSPADTPRSVQEIVNAIRGTSGIREIQVTAHFDTRTLGIQAPPAEAGLAEWVFHLLEDPNSSGEHQYTMPGRWPEARLFFLLASDSPQQIQELVNAIRSIAEVQLVTAFTPRPALVLRGEPWAVSTAEWMIHQLDTPPTGEAASSYTITGRDPVNRSPQIAPAVRVFYLSPSATSETVQALVNRLRREAQIQRVMANTAAHAMVVRGSESQASAAERIVAEGRP
jgi:hypothetical protein